MIHRLLAFSELRTSAAILHCPPFFTEFHFLNRAFLCQRHTGMVGELAEGLKGDYQLLIIKLALDVFTALIFSITLGAAMISIAVPQFLVQALLFFRAISAQLDHTVYE